MGTESPEIGKGGWLGTAEFAAVQPTVHVDINVTMPISSLTNSFFPLVQGKKGTKSEESTVGKKLGGKSQKAGAEHCLQKATTSDYK